MLEYAARLSLHVIHVRRAASPDLLAVEPERCVLRSRLSKVLFSIFAPVKDPALAPREESLQKFLALFLL